MCDMESLKRDLSAVDSRTVSAITFNVASSIGIILTNKAVFDLIDFKFGTRQASALWSFSFLFFCPQMELFLFLRFTLIGYKSLSFQKGKITVFFLSIYLFIYFESFKLSSKIIIGDLRLLCCPQRRR